MFFNDLQWEPENNGIGRRQYRVFSLFHARFPLMIKNYFSGSLEK